MTMKTTLRFAIGLLPLITASIVTERYAGAESYPTRAVKILQPYPAGGPGDVIARVLAQKLSEQTGGQFYVENLPGAGGTIGAGAASKAPADGYTILMINQDFVLQPIIKSKVPYDAFNSFAPVGLVATAPEMISVHPSVSAKDVKELIALLKANPGKYSYATPGHGTSPHLACERLFRISHGLDVVHVPFQGGAPAVQSTIARHTQIIHIIAPAVATQLKEGTLRALAVASKVRSAAFPNVPTLEEAGVPNHEVAFWMGGLVPVGTPREIIQLLQAQLAKAMSLPDVKQRLAVLGFEPAASTPEEFAAHMRAESEIWKAVVRDANIKVE
jgi:tripartite-type tricarboxylate transporter receptor subunit TctC